MSPARLIFFSSSSFQEMLTEGDLEKPAICLFHGSSYVRTHKVLAIAWIFCWMKQNCNHTAVYAGRFKEKCELALRQNN